VAVYEYKGLNKSGKEVSGVAEADNERALKANLKREGIFLTQVGKGKKEGQGALAQEVDIKSAFERITGTDLAVFIRQLATLQRAGIPLVESLGAVADQIEKPKLQKIVSQLKTEVNEGSSLAAAMQQHPKVFGPIFSNMVKAGEASGTLDQVLLRLAEFTEAQVKLKQKVVGALTYPVLMLGFGGLVLAGMFAYVIPQITQIFEDSGQDLPFITQLLIGVSHGLRDYWYIAMVLAGFSAWMFRRWVNTEKGRYSWDKKKLNIPIFGPLLLMVAISRFTKTLATLLRSGVPLLTALDITKNVMNNVSLNEVIEEARVAVREGANLADPLKRSGRFPPIVTHMIAIGERSGALDEMLVVVADAYESQADARIATLTTLLEPLMIVAMGITIAIIVFAVLMPILQLNEFVN
jgi:general secretion pathway protein F